LENGEKRITICGFVQNRPKKVCWHFSTRNEPIKKLVIRMEKRGYMQLQGTGHDLLDIMVLEPILSGYPVTASQGSMAGGYRVTMAGYLPWSGTLKPPARVAWLADTGYPNLDRVAKLQGTHHHLVRVEHETLQHGTTTSFFRILVLEPATSSLASLVRICQNNSFNTKKPEVGPPKSVNI